MSAEGGVIVLILPNKFQVAQYAFKLREHLLENFELLELADLSEMDIFHKAGVYPIVVRYRNMPPRKGSKIITRISVRSFDQLQDNCKTALVPQEFYRSVDNLLTYFCLPYEDDIVGMFLTIFNKSRPISDYLCFRSAVSFHKTGLRERFVRKDFDERKTDPKNVKKYLGGVSYSRMNEIAKFQVNWNGYYIDYDQQKLKEVDNKLPPLSNFECEKIMFCQHAREITATYDSEGVFVTKDVYPIAYANPNAPSSSQHLKYFTGLMNSSLFDFIYGIIYKGIQIGSGYYHYLPTWLGILPVIEPSKAEVAEVERLVDSALQCVDDRQKAGILKEIDSQVYKIYGITEVQQKIIKNFLNKSE
jgi:hypothetical protein